MATRLRGCGVESAQAVLACDRRASDPRGTRASWSAAKRCRLRIESASSTSHCRQRSSQSRGQTRPSDAGSVRSSVTISAAALELSPAAMRAMKLGMSSRAGHPVWQGPTQSPAWSESSSSSEVLRAARTSSESVITTMPSAAGVAQDGQRLGRPSIFTAHRKQEADGSKPSTWQSVGMAMPSAARRLQDCAGRDFDARRRGHRRW